jgi:hypothetical protein
MHPYEGRRVLVAGTGVAGAACVEVLLSLARTSPFWTDPKLTHWYD